ncbi:MAG: patatin-like phospholipase family protein [bacterium]
MKIGLVFSGGGAKGAYEIGVWKALRELGLDKYVKVVSGTSVGALNAVLFINGDIDKAEKLWQNISTEVITKPNIEYLNSNLFPFVDKLMLPQLRSTKNYLQSVMRKYISLGMIKQSELKLMIEDNIDFINLQNTDIICYACAFNIKQNKPVYFKLNNLDKNNITQYLLASTAMPLVFDKVEIDGNEYYDGGIPYFGANTPISPVVEENCDVVISVTTNQWGDFWGRGLEFENAQIWRIIPQEDQWGFMDGTFDFNPDNINKRIIQGYNEGLKILIEVKAHLIEKHKILEIG